MNNPLRNTQYAIRNIPPVVRYAALGAVLALAVFLIWFFVFRDTSNNSGGSSGPPPPRPALGKVVPQSQYETAIDSALAEVHAGKLKDAATTLEGVEGGSVPDAEGVGFTQIDNTAVISELRASQPNTAAVESNLTLLLAHLQEARSRGNQAGTADGSEAMSNLRSVLSDPAFDYERELSPLQRLARWLSGLVGEADPSDTLWRWVASLIAGLAAGLLTFLASERLGNRWLRLGLSAAVGLAVGALFRTGLTYLDLAFQMLAALGLLVAAIAAALVFRGLYMTSAPPSKPRAISELAATLGMSAGEARRRAEEAAAAQDYRLAIRYRCLAVLLALDEAGKLHFDRASTDRDVLFSAPGALQNDLQPLLDRFEGVWYGEAPVGAQDWGEYAARASALEAKAKVEARQGGGFVTQNA